ncbi:chaps-domain-containing protein [Mytilinidion resinicola]|uniref:Chaps-domain-containing protein n=1 Tax=Mytilinidion resinicola TaxID=574789 RepID=A0A6A6Z0J4_9PEZI|nr:chaps-domain-containing protein [Mytilinidion resinicola]KAF2814540.1 chaps-domain-containing protein [Mytilinidion resinicola]
MVIAPSVPEIFEEELHTAVEARAETLQTLRELGPPDLVHLVKQSKQSTKQIGVYHHVTGIDASSSASLAAYINTLTYSPHDKTNKVISGLYCCYNAFSRLDMRVQVAIPGTVESYCIDERGDKRVATDDLWLETYLCSVLRAYSYADDGSGDTIKKIVGVRRFNPITSTESEHKFLDAAERLFFQGWQLGSDPEIQVPNLVSNHLTTGLLEYINTTGRYASGINLFEKLRTRDPEISSLLARVYIAADEEVKAVQLLHETIQDLPMDYSLLDCQAEFCNKKGRGDLALEIAKRSVVSAPSEFGTWARLAEIYVTMEQWDLALLTLNSCPMFTYQDKDAPRMPEPLKVFLPAMPETICDEIDDSNADSIELVHPTLRKLHAAGFKGTFLKAYILLTEITKKIGWDQLLRIRSQVFVMEEEYRHEKQTITHQPGSRNASTTALRSPSPKTNGHGETEIGSPTSNTPNGESSLEGDAIEKPGHTITSEEVKAGSDEVGPDFFLPATPPPFIVKERKNTTPKSFYVDFHSFSRTASHTLLSTNTTPKPDQAQSSNYTQFQNKRLCERWLDNLFMVLYEDLRVYTIWRTEMAQYRQQQLLYKKSAEEWEILGELAERLHHTDEAVEAYQSCLQIKFSPKAMKGVLNLSEIRINVRETCSALLRLVTWQYRWYSEFSPSLLYTIRRLIEEEGGVKIRSIIQGTSLPQHVLDLTHHYADLCAAFRSNGTDG